MTKTKAHQFVSILRNTMYTIVIDHDGRNRYYHTPATVRAAASQCGGAIPLDSGEALEFADGSIARRQFDPRRNEVDWVVEG